MLSKHIVPVKRLSEENCIEPELVNNGPGVYEGRRGEAQAAGGREQRGGTARVPRGINLFYAAFARLKLVFITAILLAGFGLIALGVILTSTLIGAVIGIPLLLLGGFLIWLLFKFLTFSGRSKSFVFKRF
ncbi:MAG: hypothetical protein HY796_08275 [Elusimicrobia bacterium]|nr:hypothetical protein [Elusimicrobiota bacterium]